MIIVSLCDESYFKYLLSMVSSARKFFPSAIPYCYLVNFKNPKQSESEIKNRNKNAQCFFEHINFRSVFEKQCYCTNRRASLFKEIRSNITSPMMWVDADSVFVKDCEFLTNLMSKSDVMLNEKRAEQDIVKNENKKFRAGVLFVGDTKRSNVFIEKYASAVGSPWEKVPSNTLGLDERSGWPASSKTMLWDLWMLNQSVLLKMYLSLHDKIKFELLDNRFCDTSMGDDAFIWAAKDKLKSSKKYVDFMSELEKK